MAKTGTVLPRRGESAGANYVRHGSPLRRRHTHSALRTPTTRANTQGDSQSRCDSLRPRASARAGRARAQPAAVAAVAARPPEAEAIAASVALSGSARASSRLQRSTANSVVARPTPAPPLAAFPE